MIYGIKDIMKAGVGIQPDFSKLRSDEFWALKDISFELKGGETLGIIGPNGSGKTTLLKLLNGIFMPDKGRIEINGRVGALIELGAGFHPMLTGRENIYINGAVLGMSKKEIDERFDSIIEFADIGDFIDAPVKYYSSGMYIRLGFAIAIHCKPDILLIDEILAVGDMKFKTKCFDKLGELVKSNTSFILVSHDMTSIQMTCKKCLFIDKGQIQAYGLTSDVVKVYHTSLKRIKKDIPQISKNKHNVSLRKLTICDENKNEKQTFKTGETIFIYWAFNIDGKIKNPVLHFSLNQDTYHGYATKFDNFKLDFIDSNTIIGLEISYLGLPSGIYDISVGIWDENFIGAYFWDYESHKLEIVGDSPMMGRFIFEHKWEATHKDDNK